MIRHVNELLKMNPRRVFFFVVMFVIVVAVAVPFRYGAQIIEIVRDQLGTPRQLVEVRNRLVIDRQVLAAISELRSNINADRVAIYLFHNGKMTVNNIPFLFYSQTHEAVRRGVSREILTSQSLPLSTISAWNGRLIENECFIERVDHIEDEVLAPLLFDRGVRDVSVCPLTTTRGMPFGFIMVQWTSSEMPTNINRVLQETRATAVSMALLISKQTSAVLNTQAIVATENPEQ